MEHRQHFPLHQFYYYGLIPLVLALITFLLYAPSWHFPFQFDDLANIREHFHIRHHTFQSLFLTGTRWISFFVNALHYAYNQFDPFSYRVMSTSIHALNGILVFYLLNMLFIRADAKTFIYRMAYPLALTTTILFLFHPVQTQTVSYVIQAELEGLATLMILIQALSFVMLSTTSQRTIKIIAAIILFTTALLSTGTKEIAIISPILILLIDWFFIARGSWKAVKSRAFIHIPLAILIFGMYLYLLKPSFIFPALTMQTAMRSSIGNMITKGPFDSITSAQFLFSQFKVILHYLFIFIWPFDISVDYDGKLVDSFFAPDCIFPFLGLIILATIIGALWWRNKIHPLVFAALWFAISIAPRSTIIPSRELVCDYKTYLGSIGWLMIIAYGLLVIFAWLQKKIAEMRLSLPLIPYAGAALLIIPLTIFTFNRNQVWSSGDVFWQEVIKHAPSKSRAYNNYGVELTNQKRYEEAIPLFKKAIAIDPYYPDPCSNLAVAAALTGNLDMAIQATAQGINLDGNHAEAHNNLASLLIEQGKFDQAHKLLDEAIRIRPHYGKPYFNRGRIYLVHGELDRAYEEFKTACTKADMDTAVGFGTLGKVCCAQGKFDEGIELLQKSVAMDSTRIDFKRSLADAYACIQKLDAARELYEELWHVAPHDKEIIHNIGQIYLKQANVESAAEWFEKGKKEKDPLPQTVLSLAACYEKLGSALQAYFLLQEVVDNEKMDSHIRQETHIMMGHMEAHYPILKKSA